MNFISGECIVFFRDFNSLFKYKFALALDHKYSEEDWEILDTKVNPVEIPEPEVA